ncbi:MAG: DUF4403 family protein [Gammaproteobacteria bacterium]
MNETDGSQDESAWPLSTITVPITVTSAFLRGALDEVLAGLQPEAGLLYREDDLAIGFGLQADVEVRRRGPTQVAMNDNAVDVTLPVRVQVRAAWRPRAGPASLPFTMPLPVPLSADYTIVMQCRPTLTADYTLRLNAGFEYRVDRAMGFERFGVGLTFSGASRRAAEDALAALGNWLNSDDFHHLGFRDEAEKGWLALQQPVTLSRGHEVRLDIRPTGVFARPFATEAGSGLFALAIVARVRGAASAAGSARMTPLPDISIGEPPAGIAVALPLVLPFATLEAALQENVVHHPWQVDGRQVVLKAIRVEGDDTGALRVKVDVVVTSENSHFTVEATLGAGGRPRLDVDGQHLALEDFHYDVHTDSRLLNIAATLLRPFAAAILQPWLSLPLRPQAQRLLDEVNVRLTAGIGLADGVTLHGEVLGVRLSGLSVNASGLELAMETHGQLDVAIDHHA